MDTKLTVFLITTCLFIQAFSANTENEKPIIEAVNALFSLPTSSNCRFLEAKANLFQQDMSCFAPQFSDGGKEAMGIQGTKEKVKEAATKSFDKSKATVEDSARSAARLAKEAVDNTLKKLKKTLSTKHTPEEDKL